MRTLTVEDGTEGKEGQRYEEEDRKKAVGQADIWKKEVGRREDPEELDPEELNLEDLNPEEQNPVEDKKDMHPNPT